MDLLNNLKKAWREHKLQNYEYYGIFRTSAEYSLGIPNNPHDKIVVMFAIWHSTMNRTIMVTPHDYESFINDPQENINYWKWGSPKYEKVTRLIPLHENQFGKPPENIGGILFSLEYGLV